MSEELDAFETHQYQMERDSQAHRFRKEQMQIQGQQDKARAELELKKQRWVTVATAVASVSLAGVVCWLIWVVWQATAGPSADDMLRQQDKQMCLDAKGTFVYVDGTESAITCVMPGASTR